jgi:Na+/proline symporter
MRSSNTEATRTLTSHLTVCAVQLALTALAVLVSRMSVGSHALAVAVMSVATVNGLVVALSLMGVRRHGWMVSTLAVCVVVFIAGLLTWPAWDVAGRARPF